MGAKGKEGVEFADDPEKGPAGTGPFSFSPGLVARRGADDRWRLRLQVGKCRWQGRMSHSLSKRPARGSRWAAAALAAAAWLPPLQAQQRTVLPAVCTTLPGNAAVSLPLRWSQGVLQVRVDPALLPAALQGTTITGLRLRRPTFLGEPAYPALQRTLTVRGGFQAQTATALSRDLVANRPAGVAVLFGPAVVAVPARSGPIASTQVGEDLVDLVLQTPLPVVPGTLFLEFEAGDGPLAVGAAHWLDAWWSPNGVDAGHVASLGAGTCTTRATPTQLLWTAAGPPATGGTAALRLTGAPPSGLAFLWLGLAPETRPLGPGYVGFGGSLGALAPSLAPCHQWAPMDVLWSGLADAGGNFSQAFTLAATFAANGTRLGLQGGWLDVARPGVPLAASNGQILVVGRVGVANQCASVYFPGTATWSPWLPYQGQMPVLTLLHQ